MTDEEFTDVSPNSQLADGSEIVLVDEDADVDPNGAPVLLAATVTGDTNDIVSLAWSAAGPVDVFCNGDEIDASSGNNRSLVLQNVPAGEYVYQLANVSDHALSNGVTAVVGQAPVDDEVE
jgi:hypothetical protein